jgi:hypothetical protein
MVKERFDKTALGFGIGFILPALVLFIYYLVTQTGNHAGFFEFVSVSRTMNLLGPGLSLCVIFNLAAFFLFLQKEMYKAARGVLFATIVYAIYIFYLKLF